MIEEEVYHENKKCYLLASFPKEKDARYPKIKSWIRKDNFVVIRAEYYNEKGEIEKTFEVTKLKMIDGITLNIIRAYPRRDLKRESWKGK